jgi:hypothetical protein
LRKNKFEELAPRVDTNILFLCGEKCRHGPGSGEYTGQASSSIGIFLADNGFVTILKQLAVALVAAIKADGATREEPSHQCGKGCQTRSEKKMGMIRDEYACVTGRLGLRQEFSQPLEHILPIPIIYEYLSTLDSMYHDVMQNTGCLPAIARLRQCGRASRRACLGMDSISHLRFPVST